MRGLQGTQETQHSTQQTASQEVALLRTLFHRTMKTPDLRGQMRRRRTGWLPMRRSVPPSQGGDTGSNPVWDCEFELVESLQCFEDLSVSVDRSFGDDPLAGLSGDLGDEIEIGVVVQECETVLLGCGGDQ